MLKTIVLAAACIGTPAALFSDPEPAMIAQANQPGKDPDRPPVKQKPDIADNNSPIDPDPGPLPRGAVAQIGTTQFRHESKWVFFTGDAKTVISVGYDLRWFDAVTGRMAHQMELPMIFPTDADFSPESGLLALIGNKPSNAKRDNQERQALLIDTTTRKVIRTLPLPASKANVADRVRFTKDGKRVVTAVGQEIWIWDTKSGVELKRLKDKAGSSSFLVSPEGTTILFGDSKNLWAWRWETEEGPKIFLSIPENGIRSELNPIGLTPDGKMLCFSSGYYIQIWDLRSHQPIRIFDFSQYNPSLPALSPNGKILLAGDEYKSVVLWDLAAKKEVGRIAFGRDFIKSLSWSWSPDSTQLVAASDSRIFVRDVKTGKPTGPEWAGHEAPIVAMSFSKDGTLYTASTDRTILAWDHSGRSKLEIGHSEHVSALGCIAVSSDNSLVAGSSPYALNVWDAKTGKLRFKLFGNGRYPGYWGDDSKLQFSKDAKRLIAWGGDKFLRVWDTSDGKLLAEHTPWRENDPFESGSARPDDLNSFAQVTRKLKQPAAIAPSGDVFAMGNGRGEVRLFDPMSGKQLKKLVLNADTLAFSPDGTLLAMASNVADIEKHPKDSSISVLDLTTGKQKWTATVEGVTLDLTYNADGSRVAVSTMTNTSSFVWVWDASGKEQGRIVMPSPGGNILAFDHNSKRLAVSFQNTTALIYDLDKTLEALPRNDHANNRRDGNSA